MIPRCGHRPSAKLLLYRDSNRLEPPGQHHRPRRLRSAVQGPSSGHATSVGPSSNHATSAGRQRAVPTPLHSARLLVEAAYISKSTFLDFFLPSLKYFGRF